MKHDVFTLLSFDQSHDLPPTLITKWLLLFVFVTLN